MKRYKIRKLLLSTAIVTTATLGYVSIKYTNTSSINKMMITNENSNSIPSSTDIYQNKLSFKSKPPIPLLNIRKTTRFDDSNTNLNSSRSSVPNTARLIDGSQDDPNTKLQTNSDYRSSSSTELIHLQNNENLKKLIIEVLMDKQVIKELLKDKEIREELKEVVREELSIFGLVTNNFAGRTAKSFFSRITPNFLKK